MARWHRLLVFVSIQFVIFGLALLGLLLPPRVDHEGYWRNPSLFDLFAPPVEGAYRASIIKSIQRGTVTITSGSGATGTATIASVTTANTILHFLGQVSNTAAIETPSGYIQLTNATTITATMQGSRVGDNVFSFEAIQFYSGILNSLQRNTLTIANASATGTLAITAVNTSKATVSMLGYSYASSSQNWTEFSPDVVMTSSTLLTGTRIGNTGDIVISVEVPEWK